VACGVLGAAMLYTHLGSILLMGAEAAMLTGAWRRGERNGPAGRAALSAALFAPFLPIARVRCTNLSLAIGLTGSDRLIEQPGRPGRDTGDGGLMIVVIAFGPRIETGEREPTRWCAALCLIPITVLAAASVAIRPCSRCATWAVVGDTDSAACSPARASGSQKVSSGDGWTGDGPGLPAPLLPMVRSLARHRPNGIGWFAQRAGILRVRLRGEHRGRK